MVGLYPLFAVGVVASILVVIFLGSVIRSLLRMTGVAAGVPLGALSPWRRRLRISMLITGVAILAAIPWAFVEPYFPRVETILLHAKKVSRPFRIVQLSDLHCDPELRAESRVIEKVRTLKPDLVVFTGDAVNSDAGIPNFRNTMKAISRIAPLYGVRGNWEAWWFTHVDTFRGSGIKELNGTSKRLTLNGQPIWIGGCAVDNEGVMKRMLKSMPKDAYRIVLHHYPAASRLVDGRADLLLTGDTHGGQISLPFIGALVRISRWDRTFYPAGLHRTQRGLTFYVNRGIGMEGRHVPRIRFNCPPEIALFEIRPL